MTPAHRAENRSGQRAASIDSRDLSLDIAKGFGILLVVLGHCLDGLIGSGYFPNSAHWPPLAVYTIYLFHMPLFFVVSGHLASGKHRPAGAVLGRVLLTVVYPYLLWSTVEFVAMSHFAAYTNNQNHSTPIGEILLQHPIVPYWFLYALFFCHLFYLATRRLPHLAQLILASALFLAPLPFVPLLFRWNALIVLQVVRGFLYFTLGVVSVSQVKQLGAWAAAASTVLFIGLAIVFYQAQLNGTAAAAILVLPAAIAGIVATLAWSRVLAEVTHGRMRTVIECVAFLGRYSMSIYVLHIFLTAGVRAVLHRAGVHANATMTAIEIAAAMLAGVLIPLGINWLASKGHLEKWLGLQPMAARSR